MSARLATILLAVSLASAVQAEPKLTELDYLRIEKPLCKFHYDEKLETRALSILQHELSSGGARYYDASKPLVTICRKKAILMFSGDLRPEGQSLLDPPHIFVDVDVCTHRILAVDRDNGTTVTDASPCA